MEISPSYKNIQEIYADRKAIDVLTVNFFKIITQKVMEQISFNESGLNIMNLSYEWLSNQKINRVETVIGFNTINNYLGDTMTKEIYGSTYYARKKWGEETNFQEINQLSDLVIDYCSIEYNTE